MLFDSEFDYTPIKTFINGRITELQNEKGNSINELNILGNISPQFSSLTQEIIDYHTKILSHIDTPIARLGNVLNEIIVVENLPNETKNVLHNFYETHVKYEPEEFNYKVHWMRQMVYNTQNITNCINDMITGNLTSEECNCVSNLIWTKFNPHPWTFCFHSVLLEHQNLQNGNI